MLLAALALGRATLHALATELVVWHRASASAPKGCGLLFSFQSLFYLLVSFCACLVALKLRSLRFHSPRLCRAAVFLIQTNVSLSCEQVRDFVQAGADCSWTGTTTHDVGANLKEHVVPAGVPRLTWG